MLGSPLPNGALPGSIQIDGGGNIYVAGSLNSHAFVAKLTPDASQVVYLTTLAGSKRESAAAMAVGADESVYVTGFTESADFPVTAGAMQTTLGNTSQAFAASLDPAGKVRYATYIGGSVFTDGKGIAVDASGAAYITGTIGGLANGFPVSPGSISGNQGNPGFTDVTAFVIKLDPAGSTAPVSIIGFGGNKVLVDGSGNIIATGALSGPVPTTTGAFQSRAGHAVCGNSFLTGMFPCFHQHVAKIDPTGTKLIFGTYVSGYYGATPFGMALDPDGNIVLAGVTSSPDYPTTLRAYQLQYQFYPDSSFAPVGNVAPPVGSGYVTKLNPSGTALVWSTFFSGSGMRASSNTFTDGDGITGMAVDSAGNIVIAGYAKSPDLPGLWTTPVTSRPTVINQQPSAGFITRLTSDGVKLSATQLLDIPATGGFSYGLALRQDGSALITPMLSTVKLADPPRVASISDIDNTRLVRVAPGQLLTLWGTKLSPPSDSQPSGTFPTSCNGITVTFNGIAAPILYASGDQINLQVPYEISGQTEVTMQVTAQLGDPPASESFILGVAERQPSVLISPANFSGPLYGVDACRGVNYCIQPLAVNEDGTFNTSDNPAPSGSTVTIFLNGLGLTSPGLTTGAISTMTSALAPGVTVPCCTGQTSAKILETDTIPGSSTTLAQVRIQVVSSSSSAIVPLAVQNSSIHLARGVFVLIWTKPAN